MVLAYSFLLVNHYRFSRNKVLILSRGDDVFYYGPSGEPEAFDKKNILEITTYGLKGRGSYYIGKFPGYPQREQKKWLPFKSPSASSPS